jgi:hypothetical protein
VASEKIDEIDWDSFVSYGQSYRANLEALKNGYPDYYWSYVEREREIEADCEQHALEAQNEEIREQHEALFEAEQQEMPMIEGTESEPETPAEDWKVEKTAFGEIRTIEVEIIPHSVKRKGKTYTYGRIQLTVPRDLLGHRAKIAVLVPEIR